MSIEQPNLKALATTAMLVLSWVTALPSLADSIPEVVWTTDGLTEPYPLFVRADRVLLPNGKVDESMIVDSGSVHTIEREILARDSKACMQGFYVVTHHHSPPFWGSYSAVVADSDYVVVARVTATGEGLWLSGTGGTLLKLEPETWLKSRESWTEKYFFISTARFQLGDKEVCFESAEKPTVPKVGWRVLLSYEGTHHNRKNPVIMGHLIRIIGLPPEGPVTLSKMLAEQEPDWVGKSSEKILTQAQAVIAAAKEQ